MAKATPQGAKKPSTKGTSGGRATSGRSAARKPPAKKPQKLDIERVLEGKTPVPVKVDELRGVHALPGSKTAITFAAWCVRRGKLKLLARLAADHPLLLRELGLNGSSALHTAASKGPAFVSLLLEAGLDPALADNEGRLPVDMAIKAGSKAVVRLLALAEDLDPLVLLDYPEFVRRVSAGEAPRLPTAALAAVFAVLADAASCAKPAYSALLALPACVALSARVARAATPALIAWIACGVGARRWRGSSTVRFPLPFKSATSICRYRSVPS